MSKIRTKKLVFFHSSSKINNYYFIIFLRRPILDLKFPLMRAHLEAMEMDRRRDPEAGGMGEPEDEEQREEATLMQEIPELRYFRYILGATSRPRPEFPTYDGSLVAEHLIDWIGELDKYFEYDEVEEGKRVKLAVTRLKGHASLWWDSVQTERRRKNKPLIKS